MWSGLGELRSLALSTCTRGLNTPSFLHQVLRGTCASAGEQENRSVRAAGPCPAGRSAHPAAPGAAPQLGDAQEACPDKGKAEPRAPAVSRPRLSGSSPATPCPAPAPAPLGGMRCARGSVTGPPPAGQRETAPGSPAGCRLLCPAHLFLPRTTFRVSGRTAEPRPPPLPPLPCARAPGSAAGREGGQGAAPHTPTAPLGSPRPRSPALRAPGRAARGPAAAPGAPRRRLAGGARAVPLVSMSERRACGLRAAAPPSSPAGPHRDRTGPAWPPDPLPPLSPVRTPPGPPHRAGQERTALLTPTAAPASHPAVPASKGRRTCLLQTDKIKLECWWQCYRPLPAVGVIRSACSWGGRGVKFALERSTIRCERQQGWFIPHRCEIPEAVSSGSTGNSAH